jgi:hypothetical protein
MGVEPKKLKELVTKEIERIISAQDRKSVVAEIFQAITGKTEEPKTNGYTFYLKECLKIPEYNVEVEFTVESTKDPLKERELGMYLYAPKSIANNAFFRVIYEFLALRYLFESYSITMKCKECDGITMLEYGFLVQDRIDDALKQIVKSSNVRIYITETYNCSCIH